MRKPAHLERAGGKSLRQRIWERIRRYPERFSTMSIATDADIDRSTVRDYIKALERGNYSEIVETHKRPDYIVYRLVRNVGVDAPRLRNDGTPVTYGNGQDAMWRTMRISRADFSLSELSALASTDDCIVDQEAAAHYIKHLHRAGYLKKTKDETRGKHAVQARYVLARDTGPRAPMIQRTKCVYDPNLGEIVWHEEIDE
ncbi:MAG: hypothetical protein LBI35_01100 [Burkholderiales bacterium]|jgi:predicted transcriptional regulator|nr:hypothetical protein [Burkholderiales bacterium]